MRHSKDVRDKHLITDQIHCIVVGTYLSVLLWGALGRIRRGRGLDE